MSGYCRSDAASSAISTNCSSLVLRKERSQTIKHTTVLNRVLGLLRTTCASKHAGERDLRWTDHLQGNRATKPHTGKRSLGLTYHGQTRIITVSWKGRKAMATLYNTFSQIHLDIPQQSTGAGSIPQMLPASSPRAHMKVFPWDVKGKLVFRKRSLSFNFTSLVPVRSFWRTMSRSWSCWIREGKEMVSFHGVPFWRHQRKRSSPIHLPQTSVLMLPWLLLWFKCQCIIT